MKAKILLTLLIASVFVTPSFAYESVQCDSEAVFAANSCGQCFSWDNQSEWETIGFLSDDWVNTTDTDMIVYKEIQEEPRLINLDPDNVAWSQVPSSEGFWEYTSEFENIYSEAEDGYVLEAGKKITWIKSKLGYGYQLWKNTAAADENIGLLVLPITTNALLPDGSISDESKVYNECVLYKSGTPTDDIPPVTKDLPKTGPAEYIILAFLAMLLGFVVLQSKRRTS